MTAEGSKLFQNDTDNMESLFSHFRNSLFSLFSRTMTPPSQQSHHGAGAAIDTPPANPPIFAGAIFAGALL